MAKWFTVSEAFKSKNRDTQELDVDAHGNQKWMFKVEGQRGGGWMSLLRKQGSDLKPGDQVYGIEDSWPDGNAKFVRQQPPEDAQRPAQATRTQQSQPSGSVEEKLDFIISLLENFLQSQGAGTNPRPAVNSSPQDNDTGIDLSQMPY